MTDIQQARDKLAKWRENSGAYDVQPWSLNASMLLSDEADVIDRNGQPVRSDGSYAEDSGYFFPDTARLIVGTAGNPDLLDAIDDLLAVGQASKGTNPFAAGYVVYVEHIAAAVIIADERMTS